MQSPWPYKIAETHIIFMLPYTMSKSIFFYTPFLSPRMENFFFPLPQETPSANPTDDSTFYRPASEKAHSFRGGMKASIEVS
ncbi:hypothetical protein GTCCBUS3UF5_35390 [Geobacillus thermoleovorans CCB_US3_UF5]|uniref:Uncharacterized protein n=2 Tax=Geobacillus TaxID=129337 RepID=A0A1Q5T795_9BACL|nr:hypothetical protein GTCCBUS3UF5_35390 [Geobacillus thermoleovorans CCB_US3_UF5]OKO96096.1 hypothetical protein BRO54_0726 [Geobacillus proteiniphilus]